MLNKSSKELLIDKLNSDWKKNYTLTDVDFESLEVMPKDHEKNTGLTVKPINGSTKLAAPKNIYYDRLNLSLFGKRFGGKNGVLDIQDASYTSVHGALAAINAAFGTGMTADDLEDTAIGAGSYPKRITVKAKRTSLVFIGQFQLQVVAAADTASDDDATDTKVDLAAKDPQDAGGSED